MSQLGELLFPLPDRRRTGWSILNWWESRRLVFNAFVGAAGLVTLVLVHLLLWLPPHPIRVVVPWQPVVAYGVLANVCYTLGWLTEAGLQRLWGDDAPRVGPALFRQGLAFSVGLTLFPVALAGLSWLVRIYQLIVR
jgi:hypothetical protein